MNFEDENNSEGEGQNIEELLDDLGLGDEANNFEASKKDSVVFIIDCCEQILKPLEGEQKCQLEIILEGYYNFLQMKIIANANDKVGLILYNVTNSLNSINQEHIYKVHSLSSEVDARRIKEAGTLFKNFHQKFGQISKERVSINSVFWEYGSEISALKSSQYYLRLFLFTHEDDPHPIGDEDRLPSIKRAQQLAAKNVEFELFPTRKAKKCSFDIRKFYTEVVTINLDDANASTLDSSSKIMDLQQRLRQKEYKKRTLNRLTMKIGKQINEKEQEKPVQIGVKIYSLFTKAKRPTPKKVDAKTNKLLQRVTKRLNSKGDVLFDGVVGTYYPLGGQKIKITKEDMNKIKNLEPPGMTLVGFKPKSLIKSYHNLRTSYFLYPDEEHISGSSQFFDSLISELSKQKLVGIVKLVPRNNQQLRFAALIPQQESYDEEDHFQIPPGFNMIILPFADDIVNFVGDKTIVAPTEVSTELIQVTKLLINSLVVHDFDFRDFENPSLQKFYSHLQAHALNEKDVHLRPDLLEPDVEGFNAFRDIIEMVKETVMIDCEGPGYAGNQENNIVKEEECAQPNRRNKISRQYAKSETGTVKSEHSKPSEYVKTSSKLSTVKEEENLDLIRSVEEKIMNANLNELKVAQLKSYLRSCGLDDRGKKDQLIDRVINYMTLKNNSI